MSKFKKNQQIRHRNKNFQCICCDKQIAIFAPITKSRNGGTRTQFKNMFATTNDKSVSTNLKYTETAK